jgi:hypothetical protein
VKTYQESTPTERLAHRKRTELTEKLKALQQEFDSWSNRSKAGGDFEKHHTQLRAINAHLGRWNAQVHSILSANLGSDTEVFLASIYNAERLMLSEHRIWEYFRSKFGQRNEKGFRTFLRVADEFAFACYKPVQERVFPDSLNVKRKEPPLVFFNGGTSPFSLSRGKSFQPEAVSDEPLNNKEVEIITRLPIPLVGIPWNQIKHFPDAVVIGHEVGHIVEDDFDLKDKLKALLAEAITERKAEERHEAWKSWLGEVFADVYGCLATGPAFAGALIDFLARDYGAISTEKKTDKDWGAYPTIYLRGRLVLQTLKSIGFQAEAAPYERLWKGFQSKMPEEYVGDIPVLVSKLLDGELFKIDEVGNRSLRQIFCFSAAQQKQACETLYQLKNGFVMGNVDPRVLFAAIRMAYEDDPEEFIRKTYSDRMLAHFENDVIERGVRAGEIAVSKEQVSQKLAEYERAANEMIDELLKSF